MAHCHYSRLVSNKGEDMDYDKTDTCDYANAVVNCSERIHELTKTFAAISRFHYDGFIETDVLIRQARNIRVLADDLVSHLCKWSDGYIKRGDEIRAAVGHGKSTITHPDLQGTV